MQSLKRPIGVIGRGFKDSAAGTKDWENSLDGLKILSLNCKDCIGDILYV
jgi:hypothetical protein